MRIYFAIIIVAITASCSDKTDSNSNKSIEAKQEKKQDSVIVAVDSLPMTIEHFKSDYNTPVPFINLKGAEVRQEGDSIFFIVGVDSIPDSIYYNSHMIKNGYYEYGLSFAFRNLYNEYLDSITNNLCVELEYDVYSDSLIERTTFSEFLRNCTASSKIIYQYWSQDSLYYATDNVIEDLDVTRYFGDDSIYLVIHAQNFNNPIRRSFFHSSFNVKSSWNYPTENGKNNYLTTQLISDTLLFHPYRMNSSRRID